jgi:ribosomal protein S18 acetylase RimI-like enzyme
MDNLSYRKAEFEDIALIIELAEKEWKPTYSSINSHEQNEHMFSIWYSPEGLKKQMLEGQTFWLLSNYDNCIGYAAYSSISNTIFKLNKIYIIPSFKGIGVGKKFLSNIENTLKNLEVDTLQLNVNRNNQAINFYEACGYKIIREEDIPFDNYWMNDYVMEKKLSQKQAKY